jgi:hypothetical protein
MKVSGVVLSTAIKDGSFQVLIKLNGSMPKPNDLVTVKWGKKRSPKQNALYFLWLQFVIDNGAKDAGYFDTGELHEALAGRFLSINREAPGGFKTITRKSTTELDKVAFGEYFERCQKTVREYLKVDDASFWVQYFNEHSSVNQG